MSVELISVPYYLGHRGRGMGAGPSHLIDRGVVQALRRVDPDVSSTTVEYDGALDHEVGASFAIHALHADAVRNAVQGGRFPLSLAGNCSSCLGTLGGLSENGIGIVWLDAHGDFHTPETTSSGFFDGFPLSMAVGRCWSTMTGGVPGFRPVSETHVILAGVRDLDTGEDQLVRTSSMAVCECADLQTNGMSRFVDAIERLKSRVNAVYMHVDMDVHDGDAFPANSYAPSGGLSPTQVDSIISMVMDEIPVRAASVNCYDPTLDPYGHVADRAIDVICRLASR